MLLRAENCHLGFKVSPGFPESVLVAEGAGGLNMVNIEWRLFYCSSSAAEDVISEPRYLCHSS